MIRVAISYRVLQAWRVPVFHRLSKVPDISIMVFYGEDFDGTKVVSYSGATDFASKKLPTKKIKLSTRNGKAYIPFNSTLYRELKAYKPDVVISEGASNFVNNIICFMYAKRHRCKIVQWGLGEIQGRKRSTHRKALDVLFKYIEKNSDGAISYSTYGAKYYKKVGVPPEKVVVAVNVVDTESRMMEMRQYCLNNRLAFPSPVPMNFNLLFVGSLSENKGVDKIIEAMVGLRQLPVTLTIVGDGPARAQLEEMVRQKGLQDQVNFVGHVTSGIAQYFYFASLFILPGLGGLAVSDALVHGVPVICSVGDGCEQDLINGKNGIIVPDLTAPVLEILIRELYNNPEKLEAMRLAAQDFYYGPFNIGNYVEKLESAVRLCLI